MIIVKEQRVDGSSVINIYMFIAVRCTLVAGKPVLGRKKLKNIFKIILLLTKVKFIVLSLS